MLNLWSASIVRWMSSTLALWSVVKTVSSTARASSSLPTSTR